MVDFYARGIQGYEQGRQRAVRNRLNELTNIAITSPPELQRGIAAEMARVDAATGQQFAEQARNRELERLRAQAAFMQSAAPEIQAKVYGAMRPGLQAMGIDAPEQYSPELAEPIRGAVFNMGGSGLRVQSTKVGEDGQIYNVMSNGAIMPTGVFAENRQQWVETTDAQGRPLAGPFNPRAGVLGGSPSAQQGSVQISPTGEAPMPDAATMQQIIQGIQSGRPFTVPASGNAAPAATQGDLIRGRLPEEQAAAVTAAQEQAKADAARRAAAEAARGRAEGERAVQPLPTDALKLVLDAEDKINGAGSLQNRLNSWQEKIRSGRLQLSPGLNLRWEAELAAGNPSPQAVEYGNFKADLESIRNDVLRLNAGVQTEGDAQRAMNELVSNFGSGSYVMERLKTLANSNSRAVQFHRQQAERIRSNYGQGQNQNLSDDDLINKYLEPQ